MSFHNKTFWMTKDIGCLTDGEMSYSTSSRIEPKRAHHWFMDASEPELFCNKKQAIEAVNSRPMSGVPNVNISLWDNTSSFPSVSEPFTDRLFGPAPVRAFDLSDRNFSSVGTGNLNMERKNFEDHFGNDSSVSLSMSHAVEFPSSCLSYGVRKVKVNQVRDSESDVSVSAGHPYNRGDNNTISMSNTYSKIDNGRLLGSTYNNGDKSTISIGPTFNKSDENFISMGHTFNKGDGNFMLMGHNYNKGEDSILSMSQPFDKGDGNFISMDQQYEKGDGNIISMGPAYNKGHENFISIGPTYDKANENFISGGATYDKGGDNTISIGPTHDKAITGILSMSQPFDKGDGNFISMDRQYEKGEGNIISMGPAYNKGHENFISMGPTYDKANENFVSGGAPYEKGGNNTISVCPTHDKAVTNVASTGTTTYDKGDSSIPSMGQNYNKSGGTTISFGGFQDESEANDPSGRIISSYDMLMSQSPDQASKAPGQKDSVERNGDPIVSVAPAATSRTDTIPKTKEKKTPAKSRSDTIPKNKEQKTPKVSPNNFPSNVKSLLSTGILDGVPVKYVSWSREKSLRGVIKGSAYLCDCKDCNLSKAVNAYEFERHAGCKTKHPNNHIYFENGKTIYAIVQELKSTPQELLFDAIQNVTGSPINQKNFRIWKASYQAATRELQRIYGKDEVIMPS